MPGVLTDRRLDAGGRQRRPVEEPLDGRVRVGGEVDVDVHRRSRPTAQRVVQPLVVVQHRQFCRRRREQIPSRSDAVGRATGRASGLCNKLDVGLFDGDDDLTGAYGTTTAVVLSSNKIQNGDIPGPLGKWPLKRRDRETPAKQCSRVSGIVSARGHEEYRPVLVGDQLRNKWRRKSTA